MSTIGIDARFYGYSSRGLGRYTAMLLKNLEKIDHVNRYLIYLNRDNYHAYKPDNPNFIKKLADVPWYSVKEQLCLPFILDQKNIDLMHFPHFNVPLLYRRPFIVTIHDLILMHYPTEKATTLSPFRYRLKEIGYKLVLKKALKKAQKIITVSRFTQKDILKYFPRARGKIKVIYQAGRRPLRQEKNTGQKPEKNIKSSYSQSEKTKTNFSEKCGMKPYLLYVGAAYPHKNLKNLILAFKKVKQKYHKDPRWKNLKLILAGGNDYFYRRIKKFSRKNSVPDVKFLGIIRREASLKKLFYHATLFIFPSFYEGFGLPPLEAMAQNTPVISSKAASLPEVLGKAACFFNPLSVDDIAETTQKVLNSPELQKKLINQGKKRIAFFSWQKTARLTLALYQEALKNNRKI
ncbi:MAG: glycosyltransferase family 1 protein [Patescibacteria group bacterium]|nr:glycosyltransferase family 4 protein [Patescibacteria group bacterium]